MSEPTIALYYQDDYLREMEATLLSLQGVDVVLDRTAFYPRGGNQDCDQGALTRLEEPDKPLPVLDVTKDDAGIIHHRMAGEPGAGWVAGVAVRGKLDWERRFTLMRLHTAQHMISRWFLDRGGNETTRVDIGERGCTIELAREVSLEDALDCVGEVNVMIRQGRPVRRVDTGGYIEILVEEYDRQPCGGTHVADVAEIGRVALVRHKQNRLEIVVGEAAQSVERRLAEGALALLGELEADLAGFGSRVERLLREQRQARAELLALREEVARHRIGAAVATLAPGAPAGIDLPMVEARALPRLLKQAQGPGRIFACLCSGRNLVVVSGEPGAPANTLIDAVKSLWGISGGGSPAVAMCGPLPEDVGLDRVLAVLSRK